MQKQEVVAVLCSINKIVIFALLTFVLRLSDNDLRHRKTTPELWRVRVVIL